MRKYNEPFASPCRQKNIACLYPHLLPQAVATIENNEKSVFDFGAITGTQTCEAIAGNLDSD